MQTLAPKQSESNPSQSCGCACRVHWAIDEARAKIRSIGFDNSPRGIFFGQLYVILPRLDQGLPATCGSLESLWTAANVQAGARGVAA